jgi:hypothetical protein
MITETARGASLVFVPFCCAAQESVSVFPTFCAKISLRIELALSRQQRRFEPIVFNEYHM